MAVTEAQLATMAEIESGEDFAQWVGDPIDLYAHRTKPHVLPVNYWTTGGGMACLRLGTSGKKLAAKISG